MKIRRYLHTAVACSAIFFVGCVEQKVDPADPSTGDSPTAASAPARIGPFKFEITLIAGNDSLQFAAFFRDHYAIEFEPGDETKVAAVYDLVAMSWQEFDPPRKVTMADCESWGKATTEISRKSLSKSSDPELTRFVKSLLDPQFDVTSSEDAITLANDVLTYRISNPMPLDSHQRQRFFAYDRLNAYRKAMTDRKLPPFPQLAVDDELEHRQFAPGTIKLTIATPTGDVDLKVNIRVVDMTDSEVERVTEAIRRAGSTDDSPE